MQLNPLGFVKEAFEVDRAGKKSDADGTQDLGACIKEKVSTPSEGEGQQDAECKVQGFRSYSLPGSFSAVSKHVWYGYLPHF